MWDKDSFIVSVIIGVFRCIAKDIYIYLKMLGFSYSLSALEKTVILGKVNILRKALSIKKRK